MSPVVVEGNYVACGVNSGIGAPRPADADEAPCDLFQRRFDGGLQGRRAFGLPLKPGIRRAIIGNDSAVTDQRLFRCRGFVACRACCCSGGIARATTNAA